MVISVVLVNFFTIIDILVETLIIILSLLVIIHWWLRDYMLLLMLLMVNFPTIILNNNMWIINTCLKLFLLLICHYWRDDMLLIRIVSRWLVVHEADWSRFSTISFLLVTNGWLWRSWVDKCRCWLLLFKVILKWRILVCNSGTLLFR